MIVDAEVHLLHPEAVAPDFAPDKNEPMRRIIYEHNDFSSLLNKLDVSYLLQSMVENKIDYSLIMGMPWRNSAILQANNDYIEECVKKYPSKLRGFFIPDISNVKKAVRQVSYIDSSVFPGIKLFPSLQGKYIDDIELRPIFRVLEERNMFIMIHTDHLYQCQNGDTVYRLFKMVEENKKLKILAPHLGGLLCFYSLLPKISKAIQNVTFITSVSATMKMVLFAAQIIPDKLVLGTDFPFNHCHDQITPIQILRSLGLPEQHLNLILGATACELFGLDGGQEKNV